MRWMANLSAFYICLMVAMMGIGFPSVGASDDEPAGNSVLFAGGDGSPQNPFRIPNASALQEIRNFTDSNFILTNDIDASDTKNWNGRLGFEPIDYFNGIFDGHGHHISNLTIMRGDADYVGLVGYLGGSIFNIFLVDCEVLGNSFIGCLVGRNEGDISGCGVFKGDIYGNEFNVGGLVGYNNDFVSDSFFKGDVRGKLNPIGGLVGRNWGNIERSYAEILVEGETSNSYSNGGLVGDNYGTISECFSIGTVQASALEYTEVNDFGETIVFNSNGGLVGLNTGEIKNCHSHCSVYCNGSVGGLVGWNYDPLMIGVGKGKIENCYSTGLVVCDTGGGLSGLSNSIVQASFWDINASGKNTSSGGLGKTTNQMMNRTTFEKAGWNFTSIWNISDGSGYPTLRWINPRDVAIIAKSPNSTVMEDEKYYYDFDCMDEGTISVLWFMSTNATWLKLDSKTGVLSGRPTDMDVGQWTVNITASKGYQNMDSFVFSISVFNVNDPPAIVSSPLVVILEGTHYEYKVVAVDDDQLNDKSEVLNFMLDEYAPNMTIDPDTGDIQWYAESKYVLMSFDISVIVTDGEYNVFQNYTVRVKNINDLPIINTTALPNGTEMRPYFVQLEGYDKDPTHDVLSWGMKTNASWLALNETTWGLSGNATMGQYWVNITLSDNTALSEQYCTSFVNTSLIVLPMERFDVDVGPFRYDNGAAARNLTVIIYNQSEEIGQQMTNSSGHVTFNGLTEGLYMSKVFYKEVNLSFSIVVSPNGSAEYDLPILPYGNDPTIIDDKNGSWSFRIGEKTVLNLSEHELAVEVTDIEGNGSRITVDLGTYDGLILEMNEPVRLDTDDDGSPDIEVEYTGPDGNGDPRIHFREIEEREPSNSGLDSAVIIAAIGIAIFLVVVLAVIMALRRTQKLGRLTDDGPKKASPKSTVQQFPTSPARRIIAVSRRKHPRTRTARR